MVEPTGYTALDLIGFTDKGPYDPTANYVRNDLVHVGNSTWRCKIDDTTGITPTEGANWTIFIESATSLAGMSDVNLNTPKAGDGLVHDGNDWTNIPIMTKEQWKNNGAYNLCPNMWTTQVQGGLTFTKRSDGGIGVANGSPNALIYITPISNLAPIHLPVGRYKMVAFPDIGITGTQYFFFKNVTTNTTYLITDNNGIFDVTDASHEWYCAYSFDTTTVFNNAILYPMITTDLNATVTDFVGHAKTNRQLTEGVLKADYVTLTSHNITAGNVYDYALPSTYDNKKVIAISPVTVGPSGWGSTVPAVFSGINLASKLVTVRAYVTGDYSPRVLVFYRDV